MLSTVVGNFPKIGDSHEKQKLRRAIDGFQNGKISQEELARIEDEVTREAIDTQVKAGIQLITDGQIRWQDQGTWPARKLKGIAITGLIRFFDNNVYYRQPVVESAVAWTEPILVRDFQFAVQAAPKTVKVKAVLTAPYTLARLSRDNHYHNLENLTNDFAKALAKEAKALEDAGAEFIQFDDPFLPYHPEDFKLAAKALETCTAQLSKAKTAAYFYFANVEKVYDSLSSLPVHVIGLDLVSDPANAKLVREKAFGKELSLGVVDARNTKMEKESDLRGLLASFEKNRDRIQYVAPSAGLEFLPYDTAVEKLKLVGSLSAKVKEVVGG